MWQKEKRHCTPCLPQGHYSFHILCFHLLRGRTLHAVGHGLILLMMGIMVPKTCWDRKFYNRHRISCILLVLSLHLMFTMHGHKNLKPMMNSVVPKHMYGTRKSYIINAIARQKQIWVLALRSCMGWKEILLQISDKGIFIFKKLKL